MLYIKCHRHGIYGFEFVNGQKLLPDGQAGVITKWTDATHLHLTLPSALSGLTKRHWFHNNWTYRRWQLQYVHWSRRASREKEILAVVILLAKSTNGFLLTVHTNKVYVSNYEIAIEIYSGINRLENIKFCGFALYLLLWSLLCSEITISYQDSR